MDHFEPSGNFVSRVMNSVQAYETGLKHERMNAFLLSKPALSILSAGGILLGIVNLVRMASTLLFPSLCL
jgi:hypothetical protein